MFSGCSSLTSLDFSNFNTQNVTNMEYMFYNCYSLTSLDLSYFNTQNVISVDSMFSGCNSLNYIDISSFIQAANIFEGYSYSGDCKIIIPYWTDFNHGTSCVVETKVY